MQADELNTEIQTNIETVPDNDVEMLPTEIDIIQDEQVFSAMTVKNASSIYGDDVVSAAVKVELSHLIGKKVFECLPPSYVSTTSIPSKMFITEKKLPSGQFDKLKARLVAGGHKQDRSLYSDESTSSPTVALTSVLAQASIAAHTGQFVMTLDHKSAYLNASMSGPRVEMNLSSDVVDILCTMDESYSIYRKYNGTVTVVLRKALYGCLQSAVLWYKEIRTTLEAIGYTVNPYDICVFNKRTEDIQGTILLYVDDLFITSNVEKELYNVAEKLKNTYGGVTYNVGLQHDYLGMHWDFSISGEVTISMEGYVANILKKYNVIKYAKTPATDQLFVYNRECKLLSKSIQAIFHSCVMELHYLGKRIRGDILCAVSYLATRILSPNEDDEKKLDRILCYLHSTSTIMMILRIGNSVEINAYVDASFGIYDDMKSVM